MDLGALLLSLVIALGFKVIVMGATARILYRYHTNLNKTSFARLWSLFDRSNSPFPLSLFWWSLIFFALSEIFCGVETYILFQSNAILRGFHGVTSALGMALFAVGTYYVFNERSIHFSEPKCSLVKICRGCPKQKKNLCNFNTSLYVLVVLVALSILPLFLAPTEIIYAMPQKYILPFPKLNTWYEASFLPALREFQPDYVPIGVAFYLPRSTQILEWRIIPIISGIFLIISFINLRLRNESRALGWFFFALGLLCYSYFELITNRVTGDLFIGALAHEIAELIFLTFISQLLPLLKSTYHATEPAHS